MTEKQQQKTIICFYHGLYTKLRLRASDISSVNVMPHFVDAKVK